MMRFGVRRRRGERPGGTDIAPATLPASASPNWVQRFVAAPEPIVGHAVYSRPSGLWHDWQVSIMSGNTYSHKRSVRIQSGREPLLQSDHEAAHPLS